MKSLEILKNIDRKCCTDRVNGLLDLAIKELKELENRKCSNCKYSSIRFNIDCNLINKLDLPENFYCNKWENKA